MSVDLQADLEAVSSFISSANYPNPMNALEAELKLSQAQHKSLLIEVETRWGDTAQAQAA
jgi:hypothetical protein